MKTLLLLAACTGITGMCYAQQLRTAIQPATKPARQLTAAATAPTIAHSARMPNKRGPAAKATASVFWGPETFGSGTTSSLPTGWSANSMPSAGGGTWKWANTASTSTFTMGAMASTSAADGWMIFDSDAIGAASGGTPSGYLQSPAITACASQPSVRLNFENYFRNYYDSCSIWVSTGPTFSPGTYAVYPVFYNNSLPVNEYSPNTVDVHVNITGAAAMQPTVYIRFVYYGYAGGSYSWMIDDVTLSSMDPVDAALDKSTALYWSGPVTQWAAYGTKPAHLQDTLYPVSMVTNYGSTSFPAVSVNAKIFQGATSVYDQNVTMPLPVDAADSVADFTTVGSPAGYFSTTKATYTIPFHINLTGDAETGNDRDTTVIAITDSSWRQTVLNPVFKGGQYVHRVSPALSFSPATGFVMSAGHSDTITSVSIAFDETTAVGQVVGAQIFHFDAGSGNWLLDGVTQFRALTAADISPSESVTWATFKVDEAASGGYIIADGGADGVTYAAVVKGSANTADVMVLATAPPAPYSIIGYSAYSDTSYNDGTGSTQFGQDGLPYGNATVPLIGLNFGNMAPTAVKDIDGSFLSVGKAMPNPANTFVSIPVTLVRNGAFTATLTNAIGQVISTQRVEAQAGQLTRATFATGNLPAGVYIYTVSADGRQETGRVSITH